MAKPSKFMNEDSLIIYNLTKNLISELHNGYQLIDQVMKEELDVSRSEASEILKRTIKKYDESTEHIKLYKDKVNILHEINDLSNLCKKLEEAEQGEWRDEIIPYLKKTMNNRSKIYDLLKNDVVKEFLTKVNNYNAAHHKHILNLSVDIPEGKLNAHKSGEIFDSLKLFNRTSSGEIIESEELQRKALVEELNDSINSDDKISHNEDSENARFLNETQELQDESLLDEQLNDSFNQHDESSYNVGLDNENSKNDTTINENNQLIDTFLQEQAPVLLPNYELVQKPTIKTDSSNYKVGDLKQQVVSNSKKEYLTASPIAFYETVKTLVNKNIYLKHLVFNRDDSFNTLDMLARVMNDINSDISSTICLSSNKLLVANNSDSNLGPSKVLRAFKNFIKDPFASGQKDLINLANEQITSLLKLPGLSKDVKNSFTNKDGNIDPIPQTPNEWWNAFVNLDNYRFLQKKDIIKIVQPMLDIFSIANKIIDKSIDVRIVEAINNYGETHTKGAVYKQITRSKSYPKLFSHSVLHSEMKLVDEIISNLKKGEIIDTEVVFGASKLSCAGCYIVLNSIKEIYKINFNIPGTHGKFMPGWEIPYVFKDNQSIFNNIKDSSFPSTRLINHQHTFDAKNILQDLSHYKKGLISTKYKDIKSVKDGLAKQENAFKESVELLKHSLLEKNLIQLKYKQIDDFAKMQQDLYNTVNSSGGNKDIQKVVNQQATILNKILHTNKILIDSEYVKLDIQTENKSYVNIIKPGNKGVSIDQVNYKITQMNKPQFSEAVNECINSIQKAIEHNKEIESLGLISDREFNKLLDNIMEVKMALINAENKFEKIKLQTKEIFDTISDSKNLINFVEHIHCDTDDSKIDFSSLFNHIINADLYHDSLNKDYPTLEPSCSCTNDYHNDEVPNIGGIGQQS